VVLYKSKKCSRAFWKITKFLCGYTIKVYPSKNVKMNIKSKNSGKPGMQQPLHELEECWVLSRRELEEVLLEWWRLSFQISDQIGSVSENLCEAYMYVHISDV
jgi:hypothetical protein